MIFLPTKALSLDYAAMIAILSFAKCQENMQASTPTQTHIPF